MSKIRWLLVILLVLSPIVAFSADTYIKNLTEESSPSLTDVLIIEDSAGTSTKKVTVANLRNGNCATATALAANGSNCSAGNAPRGVDASGAAESCTDFEEDLSNSAGLAAALSDETGTGLAVFATSPTLTTPDIGSATGSITGNAGTATALAANGSNCSAGNAPLGVDASGAAENCFDVWTEAENTAAGYISSTLTQEQVEDYAGALVEDGTGTHTRISVTYQDATGDVDFVVDDMNDDIPEAGDYVNLTGGDGIDHSVTGTVKVDLLASGADADSATTQSDSGLEIVSNKLTMLRGCADNYILKWDETADDWNCEADATGAGGSAITFDIGDDGGDDSVDLNEIATTGDTNSIFTEPSADKMLIAVGNNWPTCDTANAGDSATAFFSSGTIEHERGGLEADVSGYSGIVGINGGTTSEVDTSAEVATMISDETGTGVLVFGTSPTIGTGDFNTPDIDGGTADSCVIGGTTPAAGSFTTLSAGSGGATIDADGDFVAKSVTVTKQSGVAGTNLLYEANSTDTNGTGWKGPASVASDTYYQFSNMSPTATAPDYGIMGFTTKSGDTSAQSWLYLDDDAGNGDAASLWSADKIFDQLATKEGTLANEAGLYSALSDVTDFVQSGEANSIDSVMYVDGSIDHEHLAPDVISGLVDVTSADADYMMIWDATDSALKKVDLGEVRGGTTAWSDVGDPTADVTIDHDAGEETNFTFTGDYTTGSQFLIQQLTGNPSGGILFEVRGADSDSTVAKFGDGTNYWQISTSGSLANAGTAVLSLAAANDILVGGSQIDADDLAGSADFTTTGDILHGADPADAGDVRLSNAETIMWEASPAGTDVQGISVDSSEVVQIGAAGASGVTITPALTCSSTISSGAITTSGTITAGSGSIAITNATGNIDGEQIADDTIDDDSIDFADVTCADITTSDCGAISATTGTFTGTLSGEIGVTSDTAATVDLGTASNARGQMRVNGDADAIDYTLPPAEAGLNICFYDISGGVITVDPDDAVDTIYLDGTSVGAGDAIDSPGSAGDFICLLALDGTRWVTLGRSGTWVDGGAD